MEKRISHTDTGFRYLAPSVLWSAKGLLIHLIQRDLLISYKQTLFGVLWVLMKPLAMAITIVFVFDKIGNFPDYGLPYILIALSALAIWECFATSVSRACICLVDDRELIVRANFPRVLLLVNASLRNSLGFFINVLMVLVVMLYYSIPITSAALLIPLVYVATVLLNLALGLWLGTANVFFRDVATLVPFAIRLGLFISPVAFTLQSVPEQWRLLYALNPLVAIIEFMRFCLFGEQFWPGSETLIIGSCSLLVMLGSGIYLFAKNERKFADVI